MWYDMPTPEVDRLEEAERREWWNFNANRVVRDQQYEEWCAVHGYDPEDANTAYLYELDTVATCGSTETESFWRENGYLS